MASVNLSYYIDMNLRDQLKEANEVISALLLLDIDALLKDGRASTILREIKSMAEIYQCNSMRRLLDSPTTPDPYAAKSRRHT